MIEPYYESDDGAVVLYCGDALDVMRRLSGQSIDACITDPPYNIGTPQRITFDNHGKASQRRLVGGDFGTFDNDALEPSDWMPEVVRLLTPSGILASFYDARNMDSLLVSGRNAGLEVVQDFHWFKKNPPVPMRSVGFSWATETGYVFRLTGQKHKHNNDAGISPNWFWTGICGGDERTAHPTQKREDLMTWLVNHWSFPGQTVLDMFSGSGTTAVACIKLGRRFVGVERDPEYCEIARKRIVEARMQGNLFAGVGV